jgi:hypothetical protein
MNCEKCQELLSDFLDGTLTGEDQSLLSTHLEECLCCVNVQEEIHAIVSIARQSQEQYVSPPNERALWLRIRNSIEIELDGQPAQFAGDGANGASPAGRASFWSRLMGKRWELSLPQLASAVAALVIAVSLVTALGMQGLRSGDPGTLTEAGNRPGANVRRPAGIILDGLHPQGYLRQQQVSIEYWTQRAEQRKASWNPRMRDAFERSMVVVDQAIDDSLTELNRNPHDEVSEEMLNAALRDKMRLLQEFSEQ